MARLTYAHGMLASLLSGHYVLIKDLKENNSGIEKLLVTT
jgi:hypothetical protein